ncbi:MAG: SprB repeat-containing protein, partial [Bacteroidales bacterium]|nr:SprB repeat-containing protein [Bacteroidales bacterium]
ATISGNNPDCYGDETTLTASLAEGTPNTYAWSSGETSASITVSPTTTTTYTVTITDANGCTVTASKNVVVNSQLTVSISGDTQVQCFGDNTATLTASASGGSMATGYTYTWTGNATGQTLTNVGAGDYSVTVTDGNNCTASANATVTGPTAALSASTTASSNVSCNGASDGSATVTANGGTPDYTYLWSNNATTPTVNGLAAGTYNVTVTDANSCSAVTNTTITQPEALTVTISGEHEIFSSANVCAGAELQLIASIEDSQSTYETPYYAWERGMNEDPSDTNSPIIWTRMNFGDYGREGEWATCDICERLAFTNCEDISYGAEDNYENYNDITIVEVPSPTAPAYTHYYYRIIVAGSVDDLNGNICISTSNTFEINVTRIAEIEFGGTNAICEGGVINLAVTETSPAGTWSIYAENGNTDGPFSATITNSGTDYSIANVVHDEITVQYTTSNANGGCWNQKTIPIYPLPEVTITPENTTICEGTDVTLHPSSNQQSSFQWSGGPSCSNTDWASDNTCADWTVNPITTTTYTLTVTTPHNILDEEGQDYVLQCAFSESKTVTVSPSVELNVTPSHIACNGESNGTVTVAVT